MTTPSDQWGWNPAQTLPPGPPPNTPPPPPGSPTVKPRKRWLVVLVGALALVLVIGIAGTALFFTRTYPPLAATYDFTDDLQDGRFSAATSQLCRRLLRDEGGAGFDEFAARISLADNVSVNLLSVDRRGSDATVEFHTSTDSGDRRVDYTLHLVQEDGDWRPCGLS